LGRVPSRARIRDIAPAEEAQTEDYREEERNPDEDEIGADGIDPEIIDPEGMDDGGEDEDRNPYESSEDLDTEFVPARMDAMKRMRGIAGTYRSQRIRIWRGIDLPAVFAGLRISRRRTAIITVKSALAR